MRVLVTGGCGFIGSNFIKFLFHAYSDENDFNDPVLDLFPRKSQNSDLSIMNVDLLTYAGSEDNISELEDVGGYSFRKADIRDMQIMSEIFDDYCPEVVVHFAAESHVDRSIFSGNVFVETNVLGTQVLLECSRKNGVKKFIHVSTDEVYGSTDEGSFSENDMLNPSSPYAASKASSDLVALSHFITYETPVIITRCTNNYGPNQHTEKLLPKTIYFAASEESIPVFGSGKNVRDWLFVYDHCAAILKVLEVGNIGEVYNIAAQDERTNIEVISSIFSSMKVTEKFHFVEDRLGHDWRYSLDDSKIRNLGWSPIVDFDLGIKHTISHYRRE